MSHGTFWLLVTLCCSRCPCAAGKMSNKNCRLPAAGAKHHLTWMNERINTTQIFVSVCSHQWQSRLMKWTETGNWQWNTEITAMNVDSNVVWDDMIEYGRFFNVVLILKSVYFWINLLYWQLWKLILLFFSLNFMFSLIWKFAFHTGILTCHLTISFLQCRHLMTLMS